MEFRRLLPALLLASLFLVSGCSDEEGDTIIYVVNESSDLFPGTTVEQNNLATDGWAFSEDGNTFQGIRIFAHHGMGTAIVLIKTQNGEAERLQRGVDWLPAD